MVSDSHKLDTIIRELRKLLADEYQRGADDTVARITAMLSTPQQGITPGDRLPQALLPLDDGPLPMTAQVYGVIRTMPGMRGAVIVNTIFAQDPSRPRKSIDRTVRTALLRLKGRKMIESRNGAWYPREAQH